MSILFSILLPSVANAAELCVNPGGTGGCFSTIQDAVGSASKNDVVVIAAGTYIETVGIPRVGHVTLQGAGADTTFIEGPADTALSTVRVNLKARATLAGLTIRNTGGFENGDGVQLEVRSQVTIRDCVIEGAVRGIELEGQSRASVHRTTIRGNSAGMSVGTKARAEVTDSTFHGNDTALSIAPDGRAEVRESTFAENGTPHTAALEVFGKLRLESSTVARNDGLGIDVRPFGRAWIANTILANNSGSSGPDCSGTLISRDFNLIRDLSDCSVVGKVGGNLSGVLPLLGTLEDNGGPTRTIALLEGSPAIDAGSPKPPNGASTRCGAADQRGVPRVNRCDMGAFEL